MQRTLLEHPREAAGIAGRLRDADPERADLWTARLRALLLCGERVQARGEVQQLQQCIAEGTLTPTGTWLTAPFQTFGCASGLLAWYSSCDS